MSDISLNLRYSVFVVDYMVKTMSENHPYWKIQTADDTSQSLLPNCLHKKPAKVHGLCTFLRFIYTFHGLEQAENY